MQGNFAGRLNRHGGVLVNFGIKWHHFFWNILEFNKRTHKKDYRDHAGTASVARSALVMRGVGAYRSGIRYASHTRIEGSRRLEKWYNGSATRPGTALLTRPKATSSRTSNRSGM